MSTTMETLTTENRCSTRLSTYSMAPTLAPSIAPSRLSHISTSTSSSSTTTPLKDFGQGPSQPRIINPMAADMKHLQTGFARMDDPHLQRQRYDASETKRDEISKLALGAKIDKALGRRMTSQDATFKVKVVKKLEPMVFADDDDAPSSTYESTVQILQQRHQPLLVQEPFVYDETTIGMAR